MTTINDLLDTIEHIARGLAEDDDLYAADDELAEVRRRVAALEAENARLKVRAEAREAQLKYAQTLLRGAKRSATDIESLMMLGRIRGAVAYYTHTDGFGEAEASVCVVHGRREEVDECMLAAGYYPVGQPRPTAEGLLCTYSTDGTPPWEAQ